MTPHDTASMSAPDKNTVFRLLLVDDEQAVLSALRRNLHHPDYLIDTCNDPVQALERVQTIDYDLVISDYRMPIIDGTTLLASIRKIRPETVRLILSAYTDNNALMEAINQAHIYRFISKPWSKDELMLAVTQALEHGGLLRENQRLANEVRAQQGIIYKQELALSELEAQYPGITRVERDADGSIILNENEF